jgi:hypothetical protein
LQEGCGWSHRLSKALICSKLRAAPFQGECPASKRARLPPVRQPFCSQLEERLLLWLEYNPLVKSYARATSVLTLPRHTLHNAVVSQAQVAVQEQVGPQDALASNVQCMDNKFDLAMVGDKEQDTPTTTVSLKVQCAQMVYDKSAAGELAQSRLQ